MITSTNKLIDVTISLVENEPPAVILSITATDYK